MRPSPPPSRLTANWSSLAGGGAQFLNQLKGGHFHDGVCRRWPRFVLLKVVNALVGVRVTEEDENLGLDLSQHGESAYNE